MLKWGWGIYFIRKKLFSFRRWAFSRQNLSDLCTGDQLSRFVVISRVYSSNELTSIIRLSSFFSRKSMSSTMSGSSIWLCFMSSTSLRTFDCSMHRQFALITSGVLGFSSKFFYKFKVEKKNKFRYKEVRLKKFGL